MPVFIDRGAPIYASWRSLFLDQPACRIIIIVTAPKQQLAG
jgi:hypothetical protein